MNKVFGVGMFKTGTTSLGHALDILGYDTFHGPWKNPDELPYEPWGVDLENMRRYRSVLEERIDRHDAFQDYPFMFIYPLVDEWYPNSKFILTTRDPLKLAQSDRNMWRNHPNIAAGRDIPPVERFVERYERHYEAVTSYFAARPDDLLIVSWSDGDGWPQLCDFLGKPVPEQAFPQANRGAYTPVQRWKRRAKRLARRLGIVTSEERP